MNSGQLGPGMDGGGEDNGTGVDESDQATCHPASCPKESSRMTNPFDEPPGSWELAAYTLEFGPGRTGDRLVDDDA
jgi:hypothetical protein